jgi:bacillopeptidase F (M6 metalloprotease family)
MPFPGSAGSVWAANTWAADTWTDDSWAGADEAPEGGAFHFRSNDFNRRRYGGLWTILLALMGALYG